MSERAPYHRTGLGGDCRSHLAEWGSAAPLCGANGPAPEERPGPCRECMTIAAAHAEARIISAENFLRTVKANVDNAQLTDAEFRQFIRDSLPIVIF